MENLYRRLLALYHDTFVQGRDGSRCIGSAEIGAALEALELADPTLTELFKDRYGFYPARNLEGALSDFESR